MRRWCSLLFLLLLAACGDLPEPFLGNPGATARRLAQPPIPRLAVPPPHDALLPDAASQQLADTLAAYLREAEERAVANPARANDWQVVTRAEQRGPAIVPLFRLLNPQGEDKGVAEGKPVPTPQWAAAASATLDEVASDAAPKIASLLTAMRHADPNNLYNRAAKVQVATVTGAPGDGNVALTRQMKTQLAKLGPAVQDAGEGLDFVVRGNVQMVPIPNNQQRVEIIWTVAEPGGDERGKVVQLNEIPAGTLDRFWADVAVVVATEAAGGVNDVILRQSGHKPGEPVGQEQAPLVEGRKAGVEPVR